MATLDKADLLKLYELIVAEEHYNSEAYHKGISFYTGLLSALTAALVAGVVSILGRSFDWYHFVALSFIPALTFVVSKNAVSAITRLYRTVLVTITTRGKLEQLLGMTQPCESIVESLPPGSYWAQEPLTPTRFLETRQAHPSGEAMIQASLDSGYNRVVVNLFRVFQVASALIALVLAVTAIVVAL